ncbi:MAG: DNA adenine methylase [Lachnospiraceae bacterium]|nr:DNA adenine methylase [Lachnospiraceae bacterium]
MRYIGGKSLLLNNIQNAIIQYTDGNVKKITDIFSGSGVVGKFMKEQGYSIISNDLLYFSYAIARGTTGVNSVPKFKSLEIKDPIGYLNQIVEDTDSLNRENCFIYENYSPNENCERMYFQNDNALRIDIIRKQIEDWKHDELITEDEYYYLLASLLQAVPYVANITGTFGSYLKFWDKRTYNRLTLEPPQIIKGKKCECYCGDYTKILSKKSDVLYADPPYNSREYLPNYHVMETIARYDNPVIRGVTGIRDYSEQKSAFCKKATVEEAFKKLIEGSNSRYILISYNNEGIISTEALSAICKAYAVPDTFRLIESDYRRYKNKIPNNTEGLKEQLYFLKRR